MSHPRFARPLRRAASIAALVIAAPVVVSTTSAAAPVAPGGPVATAAPSGPGVAATQGYLERRRAVERGAYVRSLGGSRVEATGWVGESVVDTVDGAHRDALLLHSADGRVLTLEAAGGGDVRAGGEPLESGDVVRVSGTRDGDTLKVGSAVVTAKAVDTVAPPVLTSIQNQGDRPVQNLSVLTILAGFQGEPNGGPNVTQATVQTAVLGRAAGTKTVANYYDEASRGRLSVTGQVTPWLQLDVPFEESRCASQDDQIAWITAAEAKARAAGFEPNDYSRVVVVLPGDGRCGYRGIMLTARQVIAWANNDPEPNPFRVGTVAHELGHTLNLGHSAIERCLYRATSLPITSSCSYTTESNADYSDVMGDSGGFRLLQGYQRAALGFTPLVNTAALPVDGVQKTLSRTSQTLGGSTQLLSIRRPAATSDVTSRLAYFHLDLRENRGPFDGFGANHSFVQGVSIHLGSDLRSPRALRQQPVLVNPAPGPGTTGNAKAWTSTPTRDTSDQEQTLRAGQSLYDPVEDFTITVDEVTATGAKVRAVPGPPVNDPTGVQLSGGTVTITGSGSRRNLIGVAIDQGQLVVTDPSTQLYGGGGCTILTSYAAGCPISLVRRIVVNAGAGGDLLNLPNDFPLPVRARMGLGDDLITAPDAKALTIEAEPGADGNETGYADEGEVTLDYSKRTTPVTFTSAPDPVRAWLTVTSAGESDLQSLIGITTGTNPSPPTLLGGTGSDVFDTKYPYAYTLDGGPGADRYRPGTGNETILARDGVADLELNCGGGGRVVRDATGDPAPTGCATTTTGPQVAITGGMEPRTTEKTLTGYAFAAPASSGVSGLGYRCKVVPGLTTDGGSYAPCSTGYVPAVAADGTYTFVVQATVGGVGSGEAVSRSFTRDTAAPAAPTVGAPTVTDGVDASFPLTRETGAFTECALDGGAWNWCTSPAVFRNLGQGAHTVQVRATDPAGNTSGVGSGTVTIDRAFLTLSDPSTLPVAPATEPLSASGGATALDWIHWSGAASTQFDRPSSTQLISTWTQQNGGTPVQLTGPTRFSWTNASGSTPAGAAATGVAKGGAATRGFRFSTNAVTSAKRHLRVYVGVSGANVTGELVVWWGAPAGITTATVKKTVVATSDSTMVNRRFDLDFRSAAATDTLQVAWRQSTAGATGQVALYAAAVH